MKPQMNKLEKGKSCLDALSGTLRTENFELGIVSRNIMLPKLNRSSNIQMNFNAVIDEVIANNNKGLKEMQQVLDELKKDEENQESEDDIGPVFSANDDNKNKKKENDLLKPSNLFRIPMDANHYATLIKRKFGESMKLKPFMIHPHIQCHLALFPKGHKDKNWMAIAMKLVELANQELFEIRKVEFNYCFSKDNSKYAWSYDEHFYFKGGESEEEFEFIRVDYPQKLIGGIDFQINITKIKYFE